MWGKIKAKLFKKSAREQAERAYGLWLTTPRKTNAVTFVSNMTGIPREDVWDLIYGKKN